MSTVDCNGVSINYRTVGAGDNVVLIHGLGANHAFWHLNVMLTLARQYRVTLFDLRGHGYSSMPTGGYSSSNMAKDLYHLLNHLDISRAHIIGHSFGGVVGLHHAILYPKRVASLTLVDSRVRILQPYNRPKDWPNWESSKQRLAQIGLIIPEDEDESGLWLLDQLATPKWQKARHKLEGSPLYIPFSRWGGGNRSAERWLALMQTTSARKEFIAQDGLTLEKMANIQVPALVISGENSSSIPSFIGLKKCLPNCKTEVIPGAGHFLPLTHPDLFLTMVSRFLGSIDITERRRHQRLPLKFPVNLRGFDGITFPAATVDVSNLGILLASSRKLDIGTKVEVITDLNQSDRTLSLSGNVVRLNGGDMRTGCQFAIELLSKGEEYHAWQNSLTTRSLEAADDSTG